MYLCYKSLCSRSTWVSDASWGKDLLDVVMTLRSCSYSSEGPQSPKVITQIGSKAEPAIRTYLINLDPQSLISLSRPCFFLIHFQLLVLTLIIYIGHVFIPPSWSDSHHWLVCCHLWPSSMPIDIFPFKTLKLASIPGHTTSGLLKLIPP